MASWIVVHTRPLHEEFVARGIDRLRLEAFIPKYQREIFHARRVEVRELPLYPSYLFARVELEDDAWKHIWTVRGVKDILGKPTPVGDNVVSSLGCAKVVELTAGDRVRFRRGQWEGIEAVFKQQDGIRLCCEIVFLGKKVPFVCLRADVEKVQPTP